MLKVIVIDDQIHSVTLLEHFLQEIDGIQVAATYTCPREAMANLKEIHPDVIFLDIEMPNANGIKIAEQVWQLVDTCEIVFVTAYDSYALDAFAVHAFDYILKPVDGKRLAKTIANINRRRTGITPVSVAQSPILKAQFMGDFVLFDLDGSPINWRTQKVKELCAYLLHHREFVHRAKIIEDLWPNTPHEKVHNTLYTSVYQLRKGLERQGLVGVLQYTDERYSLHLDIPSDVREIESLIDSFKPENVPNIINLTAYEYLEREDYRWSFDKREQLRTRLLHVLEEVSILSAKGRNIDEKYLEPCLKKLVALDPYNELYTKQLIQYYIGIRNISQAVRTYENFNNLLWEDLKEKPSFETRKLMNQFIKY